METTPIGRTTRKSSATPAPASLRDSLEGFELNAELHRGGQGVVYKALQKATKRTVAVKVMLQGRFASPRQRYRFEREIDLVANLQHPNIVTIFDSGSTPDGQPYYAMEYIHGKPISDHVVEKDLPVEETLRLFIKVCSAVHHAHLRGVIHRDLKPANILVDSSGQPHVLDFGLAKMAGPGLMGDGSPVTISGEFMGTLAYASPEQVEGDPNLMDIRSDVYSLGVILYQLLTAEFPYPVVGDMGEILRHIAESEPHRPSTIVKQLGDEVETIVLTALAKERERRYQTAEALGRDLERFLSGEAIEAKRDSGLYLLRKTLARYRVPVAIGAAFAVLVIAGTIALFVLYQRQKGATELAEKKTIEAQEAQAQAVVAQKEAEAAEKLASEQKNLAERRAGELRHTLYANRLALADNAYVQHNALRLRQLLEDCPQDLRDWEWRRLDWLADRSLRTISGQQQMLRVALSPDASRAVTSSVLQGIRVWDTLTGDLIASNKAASSAASVALSCNGMVASVGRGQRLHLWNPTTGEQRIVPTGHTINIMSLAFSPNGEYLATGSDGIGLWRVEDGHLLGSFPGHFGGVTAVCFDGEGQRVASGGRDGTATIWAIGSRQAVHVFQGHQGLIRDVTFSPSGDLLATAGTDATARVWSIALEKEVAVMRGHDGIVTSVEFSSGEERVVTAGNDRTLRVWTVASARQEELILGHRYRVHDADFDGAGRRVVSISLIALKVWDIEASPDWTNALVSSVGGLPIAVHSAVLSPDGSRVALGTAPTPEFLRGRYSMRVLDVRTGKRLMSPETGWSLVRAEEPVYCVDYHPDGSRVVTASGDLTVRVWDAEKGKELSVLRGHESVVRFATFIDGGPHVLSADSLGTVKLWDSDSSRELRSWLGVPNADEDWGVLYDYRPAPSLLVTANGSQVWIWNTATGQQVHHLADVGTRVTSVRLSSDGRQLLTGHVEGNVRVWNLTTGEERLLLRGHEQAVRALTLTEDGRRLFSASDAGRVKVWNGFTGEELLTLREDEGPVHAMFLDEKSARLGTVGKRGVLRIRRVSGL